MNIAQYIDHTNLKPTATPRDIEILCQEAEIYKFRGICINPVNITEAATRLNGNLDIKIASVVGFPLGANLAETKVDEAKLVINFGADELDVVWNLGAFKNKKYLQVLTELKAIIELGVFTKVIIEAAYLDLEELENAFKIVNDSGAQCIKTSTGFAKEKLLNWTTVIGKLNKLRNEYNPDLKIKASGGITEYSLAKWLIKSGVDIIGTSHGIRMIDQETRTCQ